MTKQVKEHMDQAEQLKNLVSELGEHENSIENREKSSVKSKELPKIDVLNLPPRKSVHTGKKNRTKLKFQRPFMRLLFVFFILIILVFVIIYFWQDGYLTF